MSKLPQKRNVFADYLIYITVRMLLCVIQTLPDRACVGLARALAWGFQDVLRFRESVVDENLRHAFPEATALRRKEIRHGMWLHLMLLVCEIAKAHRKIHETNWREHVSFEHCRHLLASQLTDRALVIVTAHLGNFEISGYVAGLLGLPNFAIGRPLDNPFLQRFMERFRESTGQKMISSRGSSDEVARVVDSRATLAVLGDHYGGPKGCWVDFFGRPASCHKSIALLALAHKVPLLVVSTQRSGPLLHFNFVADPTLLDPLEDDCPDSIQAFTQSYTKKLEQAIRQCPEQYWWLHRRWKDTRANLRRERRAHRGNAERRIDAGTGENQAPSSVPATRHARH